MAPRKRKKLKAAGVRLSEDERTPKRLKAAEPDLTVVVGGVEFYHYKIILCSGCDFFDTMLSTQMRENQGSRIEFPDKNPEEWLEVYSFLDPSGKKPKITPGNAMKFITWFDFFTPGNAMKFITWFDFLGMVQLATECDTVYAESLSTHTDLEGFSNDWNVCKSKPCPISQEQVLESLEIFLSQFRATRGRGSSYSSYASSSNACRQGMSASDATTLKSLILDDIGGDRIWQSITNSGVLYFPPQINGLSRVEVAENPLFEYLLQTSHNQVLETLKVLGDKVLIRKSFCLIGTFEHALSRSSGSVSCNRFPLENIK